MKLVLENIGLLKKAELYLHPLTVIAGENDNGKSTVGKVIFCVIKAMSRYKEDLQESKEYKITEKLHELFFLFRRILSHDAPGSIDLIKQFQVLLDGSKSLFFIESFNDLIVQLKHLSHDFEPDQKAKFEKLCQDIKQIIDTPESKIQSIERALNKAFSAEFDQSILQNQQQTGSIQIYENDLLLFDLEVYDKNKITLLKAPEPIEINEVTFIESPLILNFHDLLIRSQSGFDMSKRGSNRLGVPYTTLHTKDLFDKLKERNLLDIDDLGVEQFVKSIIAGDIRYHPEQRDFVFSKDQQQISIKNTASGIKAFGLLQLLSRNGFIHKNAMLVFDEPENHLHPKWQLKFAELLVRLASQGVFILVSSHSPYMIEALQCYSERTELEAEPQFYLAQNNIVVNENRLAEIFEALSEPFEVFRRMDAEALQDE